MIFKRNKKGSFILLALFIGCLVSCKSKPAEPALFDLLESDRTGLSFVNKLTPTDSFNLFDYMYYYNGSGVAAGDFNNDGKIDLFFAANQSENRVYLNEGELKFRDITKASKIPQDGGWSTGVSLVDINNDGWLDIYVSRVGNYHSLKSKNQFLICQGLDKQGVPVYVDKARDYGLDYSGFSTQAAFLDADLDGDLDMFLLNHTVHENGVYRPREEFLGKNQQISGARMYRNDGNKFTDITTLSGINSSLIGYGLGIAVADINLDGFPDIYIGNDFHENDYLYINNGKGVFTEDITKRIAHTGRFTMGVDIADVNNDGHSEIISMDMLSDDPYTLKRSLGEDDYDIFNLKVSYGYQHQYTRNNLQYNRGNGHFSEVGLYSGIAATDWSWSPLWVDFDNDGLKDLFISNGIPKRMNDIDYINFVSNEEIQKKLAPGQNNGNNLEMIEKFPKIKIRNKFFRNEGSLAFSDIGGQIGNSKDTYSNGSVYADFDNDGDLDIVVNNIDEAAHLYRNNTIHESASVGDEAIKVGVNTVPNRDSSGHLTSVAVSLTGDSLNSQAIGSKLIVCTQGTVHLYEKFGVHGFESSLNIPFHVGLRNVQIDSILLVWPDNSYEKIVTESLPAVVHLRYKKGLPVFNYGSKLFSIKYLAGRATDVTKESGLVNKHGENVFAEFNREPLLPHMLSTEGPALAVGDLNGDGLSDVFIGAARDIKPALWMQGADGKFRKSSQDALDQDSIFEDVSACWSDVNKDGRQDLIVASGGNEFYGKSENLLPRVYINDGTKLTRKADALTDVFVTASVVVAADYNGDGFDDLFIGGRAVPMEYGRVPESYLLQNDGTGRFTNVNGRVAKELSQAGFITDARWADLDKDGDPDLVMSAEWGGLTALINDKGSFTRQVLTEKKGWWNFILPVDVDNDGDLDLVAGNLGLNSRLHASDSQPVDMYYYDFDGNGRKEQILTYYQANKKIPFASMAELNKQMPVIRKKFLYAADFAKASLEEIFGSEKLESATRYSADYFSNAVLINDGKMQFTLKALPWAAQLTSFRDAVVVNANGDDLPDLVIGGNYFESNTELGRYDADMGTILINKGKGDFAAEPLNGLVIKGQVRHLSTIRSGDAQQQRIVIARNNDSTMVINIAGAPVNKK